MSCEGYRDKLVDALASGEGSLGREVAGHLLLCAECKKFYEAQVHLFGAIDSGVRAMVDETVPLSLLPRVRARVAEADTPPRAWRLTWGFAAAAIAAALIVSVGLLMWKPDDANKFPDRSRVVAQDVRSAAAAMPKQLPQPIATAPKHAAANARLGRVPKETAPASEVLVLAEERAAFARFVSDLPEVGDVAVAYTRPAMDVDDEAVELALLQINELEVKPLESSNWQ
ncbi:MAG TPA: hypothetical protein VK728_13785 [Candidatus Sulfotelmatobacter sp.]|jgi:hypothetical protein|nr:hypothetical protein [Candidatus Sulfotelmatobacter sp.]